MNTSTNKTPYFRSEPPESSPVAPQLAARSPQGTRASRSQSRRDWTTLLTLAIATLLAFSPDASAQKPAAVGQTEETNFSSDLVFDADYYLEKQPDVNRFYSSNKKSALVHWLGDGIKQGRDASPTFSIKFYMEKYSDVPKTNREAITHWLKVGIVEGRQGSEFFDSKVYLETVKGKLPNPSYATAIRHYQSLPKEKQIAYVKVAPPKGSPPAVANPLRIGGVESIEGTFFCDIDDRGTIFVNGVKVHTAGMGFSRSGEVRESAKNNYTF